MNRARLERLIKLREHTERLERQALRSASEALVELERKKSELLVQRGREEDALQAARESDADALRLQHAHLLRLQLEIQTVEESSKRALELKQEREAAWFDARREVKSLETLVDREAARLAETERRVQQKLVDSLNTRRHAVQGDKPS